MKNRNENSEPEATSNIESNETPRQKIAFVDDEENYAEMAWMLEMGDASPSVRGSFDVAYLSFFRNPKSAAEDILKIHPDLVFMDNDLKSGFTGADIVRALRGDEFKGVIVGNSGSGKKVFEEQGVANMMDGFFPDKNRGIKDFLENFLKSRENAEV